MQLSEVDLLEDTWADRVPHDMFDLLRREAPVYLHPEPDGPGFWAVTKYHDIRAVSRDAITFSTERAGAFIREPDPEGLERSRLTLLMMDPPKHTRYRALVSKGFTPRTIRQLDEAIQARAIGIVDEIAPRGECEFVEDVAAELPLQVICEMIGVPEDDRGQIFEWSNKLIGEQDPDFRATPEEGEQAATEIFLYCHEIAAARRRDPRDDIMTALVHAEVDGERLTEMELDMFFMLLVVAGNETTRNLISHSMLAMIENPDERRALLTDPSLYTSGVEEMLRWGTSIQNFRRTATRDTEVGGQLVREGEKVVTYYISANRDEEVFDDPHRFDVRRQPNEHLTFGGGGEHFCLGANLARAEIRALMEELNRRLVDVELAGPVRRMRSDFVNGIKSMPIRFRPRA